MSEGWIEASQHAMKGLSMIMHFELANEGHLEHMDEKGINDEVVEKFRRCFFAHYLVNGEFMDLKLGTNHCFF